MTAAVLAESLHRACAARSTGWVRCEAGGLVSRLGLDGGDVVALELAFGYQTPLQALLQARRVSLRQVDALWARGEARALDDETLAELGVAAMDVERAQAEAAVRRIGHLVERVSFEGGSPPAPPSGLRLDGARALRAAREASGMPEADALAPAGIV